ncbi:MAG TPA: alpha-mannosidase 2C1, partial [Patescibacteria group bacterium]|nr:alpha-mannosidase 2C1 [Patescibacteria group bacterium]
MTNPGLERLRELLEQRLVPAILVESAPLELAAFQVRGEPISLDEALRGDYRPFQVGEEWGPPWSTTWFRVRGRVPDGWLGREVAAVFDLGFIGPTGFTCEALAWKDGLPWRAVDPNHRRLPILGQDVDFLLEAAANPWATESGPHPSLSMIALRESPIPIFTLTQAELRLVNQEARRVALDFRVLLELAEATGTSGAIAALEKFEATGDASALTEALSRPGGSRHLVTAVGHAHIDTAWEWPLREAKRKCARSWSNQLALMDEHADYVFACSQPAQYAWMKESYPDIYDRLRARVAEGRWEPAGAMWVEPDCNLPSGESLVRQLLHGKRFFMKEFGREVKEVWLPDVFGYPGS